MGSTASLATRTTPKAAPKFHSHAAANHKRQHRVQASPALGPASGLLITDILVLIQAANPKSANRDIRLRRKDDRARDVYGRLIEAGLLSAQGSGSKKRALLTGLDALSGGLFRIGATPTGRRAIAQIAR